MPASLDRLPGSLSRLCRQQYLIKIVGTSFDLNLKHIDVLNGYTCMSISQSWTEYCAKFLLLKFSYE